MGINAKRILGNGTILLIAAILFGACAQERDPIDRVQPYALPKTFFIGDDYNNADDDPEFWSQNTMIDVGYGATGFGQFTSTYAQPMARLKWQITEDMLLGRASYERIDYTDGKGYATGLETQDGVIVAAFRIVSHFDIVNSYNPTTGEKLNVIEENTYDRPWYEREYIRVDWSKNMNTDSYDFDTLSYIGMLGSYDYEPLSYYVEDPADEDAPYFDFDGGYFDVTTKVFAKPGMVDLSHLGWWIKTIPACWLDADFFGGSYPSGTCNPMELTLRHSFRRVVDNDFQPLEWDGWRFQAFGGFAWTERMGYARNYGMTDALHHRFLSQFQIWERAHYYGNEWDGPGTWAKDEGDVMEAPVECYTPESTPYGGDPNRDNNGNGTADECEAVTVATGFEGSQCDTYTQKCTLPFRARKPKKMAWFYTNNSDQRYFNSSDLAVHQWDVGLRTAIRAAQYSECMVSADGGVKKDCSQNWPIYFGQQGDNDNAISLALEVDDCRNGVAHEQCRDTAGNVDMSCCAGLAASIGNARMVSQYVQSIARMPETIVMCHSPVEATDDPIGAPEGKRLPPGISAEMCATAREEGNADMLETCLAARNVRRGDLRYHLVNVIKEPGTRTPWGIMTSAVDPLNGQTIQSCSNVWAWVNDYWAQRLVDYMRFAAGEISVEEVTEGEYIKDWSTAADAAGRSGVHGGMTREEVHSRMSNFLHNDLPEPWLHKTPSIDKNIEVKLRQIKHEFSGVLADSQTATTTGPIYQARLDALRGTQVEAELMNHQMQQLYGVDDMFLSSSLMDIASPLRGGNLAMRNDMERLKQNAMAERGMCEIEMAPSPVAVNGLSKIMQAKFSDFSADDSPGEQQARADKMIDYIARRAHTCVIVHEMGHAMAHRHNFVSSSDANFYRPQYWQLRTKDNTIPGVSKLADMTDPTGETTLGPRYFDPVTPNEDENLIWMWSASSVMDYAGEATQDFLGLGAWDMAALRMFYGDSVAVYPKSYADVEGGTSLQGNRAASIMKKMDNFGGILGFRYELGDNDIHYSQLADKYKYDLIQNCHEVNTDDFIPDRYDESKNGKWHPVLDGEIVAPNGDGVYTRCSQPEIDYVPWRTLRPPTYEQAPKYSDGEVAYLRATEDNLEYGGMVDRDGRVRVPYGFATDRWADIGNAAVYRHDNGADTYEIFNYLITQQELFQVFDTYRRGRMTFSVSGASGRINGRYNGKIRDGAKGLSLQRNYLTELGAEWGIAGDVLWDYAAAEWYTDSVIASTMAFDHFVRTAQRPQPGPHLLPEFANDIYGEVLRSVEDSQWEGDPSVSIPNGAYGTDGAFGTMAPGGKLVENRLDETQGEYSANYTINAGSYYDKIWSAMMMTESVDNFISDSRGDFVDGRYRACSLADLLPDGYRRWIANNLTNDEFLKGVRVATDSAGTPLVEDATDLFPSQGMGNTMWWGDEPKVCFPVDGTTVCGAYNTTVDLGDEPAHVAVVESQMGWEAQKYLITWTYAFLPENDQQWWKDMLWLWDITGIDDSIINMDYRMKFHNPEGRTFLARRYGRETIFGKEVEKGVAARVLEYANGLLYKGYETTGVDDDGDGTDDWYEVVRNSNGDPIVLYDPAMTDLNYNPPTSGCNSNTNVQCTCEMNRACMELDRYMSVIDWMWYFAGSSSHGVSSWDDMIGIYG